MYAYSKQIEAARVIVSSERSSMRVVGYAVPINTIMSKEFLRKKIDVSRKRKEWLERSL